MWVSVLYLIVCKYNCCELACYVSCNEQKMPEEQAFSVLVKIMFNYGHREMFKPGFELLHCMLFQLDKLLEVHKQCRIIHCLYAYMCTFNLYLFVSRMWCLICMHIWSTRKWSRTCLHHSGSSPSTLQSFHFPLSFIYWTCICVRSVEPYFYFQA